MKNASILIILTLLISSCGKNTGVEAEDIARAVESGLAGLIGVVDEKEGENISDNFLATCSNRASGRTCNTSGANPVQTQIYSCTVGSSLNVSGTVTLTYGSGQTDCEVNATNEVVTRETNLSRDTKFGGKVEITSTSHNNYLNNSIGGGGRLTKLASGWQLDILGKRRHRKNSSDQTVVDISLKTSSPITITTESLARSNRNINGGTLDVFHNRAEYTASMTPNNVTYTSGCCYPTGGSVSVSYAGSITGTATVTFTSCGTGKVEKGDTTHVVSFYSCE